MVNLALNETMSFEILRMFSETSFIWQSRSLIRDSDRKGREYAPPAWFDKLNSNDFQVSLYGNLLQTVSQTNGHWAPGKPNYLPRKRNARRIESGIAVCAGEWKSCPGRHKNVTGCATEGCKGAVNLIRRVKRAHSFLQFVSSQFHINILNLPM